MSIIMKKNRQSLINLSNLLIYIHKIFEFAILVDSAIASGHQSLSAFEEICQHQHPPMIGPVPVRTV